jgi:hypothetical protein
MFSGKGGFETKRRTDAGCDRGRPPDAGPRSEERRAHLDPLGKLTHLSSRSPREGPVLQTDDLFLGAFGLVRGGELEAVEVRGTNGRRVAVFTISGPGLDEAVRDYHRGQALVDLRLLKSEVRRLKDVAFEALRREERRADAGHEGRDRADQVRERPRGGRR